jgi:ADYC domain
MNRFVVFALILLIVAADFTANAGSCRPSRVDTRSCDLEHGLSPWNGPYLEGPGLETLHFVSKNQGAFPPAAGSVLTSTSACGNPSNVSVTLMNCSLITGTKGAALCNVHSPSATKLCTTANSDKSVIAVKGYWDGTGAWHNDVSTITLSCDVQDPSGPQGSVNSAIGTCVNGGYSPGSNGPAFLACIRALRFDYCGDGTPHTRPYTPIGVHDNISVNTMSVAQCTDGKDYEATWSADGAVCLYHDRWTGKGMSDEQCSGPNKPTTGSSCKPDPRAVVVTRSACNVCPTYKGAAPNCSPDQDPVCAPSGSGK